MTVQWIVEAWTLPDDPDGFRPICRVPALPGSTWLDTIDGNGAGTIRVPATWPHLNRVLAADPTDPGAGTQAILAVFRPGQTLPDFEFRAQRASRVVDDEGVMSWAIRGVGMRGALDDAVVEPRTAEDRSWIWAGDDLLPPRALADLAAIRAEWHVSTPGETYEVYLGGATGGTWTVTVDGNTTSGISWSASAGTVAAAINDLPGVTGVAAVVEDGLVTFEFQAPRQAPGAVSASGAGLTGGTGLTLTKLWDGFDSTLNPDFTLTIDAGTTAAMAWNAGLHVVENRLEALPGIDDVSVSGTGTLLDPWRITAVRPADLGTMSGTFAAGDVAIVQVQAGVPDPGPFTRSQRIDERDPTASVNHGTYSDPPVEVDTTTTNTGSDWSLAVNATGQFGGSQIVRLVQPGQLMQVAIPIYSPIGGLYRAIVRDPWGNLIKATTPFEVPVPAATWTTLTIDDVTVPPGITEVIIRVAVVDSDPATWTTFYVDWQGAAVYTGMAAATPGDILLTHLERAWARGTLLWLAAGFTRTHDSASVPWDQSWAFRSDPRERLGTHTAGDLEALGYEWTIRRLASPGPGGETHEVCLWNPGGRAPAVDGAAFVEGANLAPGGSVEVAAPERTVLLVESDDRQVDWVTIPELGDWPRREDGLLVEWAPGLATAQAAGEATLRDDLGNLVAVQLLLTDQQTPYLRFGVGSTVPVIADGLGRHDRRVSSIAVTLQDDDRWLPEVTCSRVYGDGETATDEAVRRLLAVAHRRRERRPSYPQPRPGSGGVPVIVLAAVDASELSKRKADVLCDGATDAAQLNDAGVLAGAVGGMVWLTEGNFYLSSQVEMPYGVSVVGQGVWATFFRVDTSVVAEPAILLGAGAHSGFRVTAIPGGPGPE